jgi:hypothetical protein
MQISLRIQLKNSPKTGFGHTKGGKMGFIRLIKE